MTSYFKHNYRRQCRQFYRLLDQAGLSHEDVERVLADPTLAVNMVAALRTQSLQLAPISVREQVKQQLNAWNKLGVTISNEQLEHILQQADAFEPVTDSDEPLVTGGFGYNNPKVVANKLFEAFIPRDGNPKVNHTEDAEVCYAPGMKPTGGLRLVHFDPNAYAGLSPEAALKAAEQDKLRLAGIEVLEHLVLNPQSGLRWDGKSYYYPNLSGLQQKNNTIWSSVPCLHRWDDSHREFRFYSYYAGYANPGWSSPVVRECSNLGS